MKWIPLCGTTRFTRRQTWCARLEWHADKILPERDANAITSAQRLRDIVETNMETISP